MVPGRSEDDVTSLCYLDLGLDSDATFSDIRNSYQSLPSPKFQMEAYKFESSSQNHVYLRLLTQFLRDPDIRAQWDVAPTERGSEIA